MAADETERYPRSGEVNMATWYELYRAAVLETDWSKMEERIQAAESAISGTLREFSLNHGGTPDENKALADALNSLHGLRRDVAMWRGSKFAS
jgi:hypothetical protein